MEENFGLRRVEETFVELETRLRARGWWVFVRTDTHPVMIGKLWLPPKLQDFHGQLPHLQNVTATVLSAGTVGVAKQFKSGDRICFARLYFSWWKKMADGTYVGWVDANQVHGYADDDFVKALEA